MPIVLVSLPILTAECAKRREFGLSRREESINGSQSRLLERVATAKKIQVWRRGVAEALRDEG